MKTDGVWLQRQFFKRAGFETDGVSVGGLFPVSMFVRQCYLLTEALRIF